MLNYLLGEQGNVYAVVNITYCTWFDTSGEVQTQLHKIIEQTIWYKKMTPSVGALFNLFDFDCFGSWGP